MEGRPTRTKREWAGAAGIESESELECRRNFWEGGLENIQRYSNICQTQPAISEESWRIFEILKSIHSASIKGVRAGVGESSKEAAKPASDANKGILSQFLDFDFFIPDINPGSVMHLSSPSNVTVESESVSH